MSRILVIDSHSPDLLATGAVPSADFVRTLLALDPATMVCVHAPYAAPLQPGHLDGIDGVIFSGAGVAWSVEAPEAAALRHAMALVFDAGLPVWGSCNGMQLAAVMLGGSVGAARAGFEVGLAQDVTLTLAGQGHPMMAGRAARFAVPCIHRDEVQRLPEGAELLAGNAHSRVQAFAYRHGGIDFWGTQYHPELTPADIAGFISGSGLFHHFPADVATLSAVTEDAEAAARFGTTPQAQATPVRAQELANWLGHVAQRAGVPLMAAAE
jgi:GMP synthase (glutamine-hydrolysing)